MTDSLLLDLRSSLRGLLRRPALVTAVVLTLALGIGFNTAIFSLIQGLLLRPLPYPHSEQLVHIFNSYPKRGVVDSMTTVPDYLDRRAGAPALADSALYYDFSFDLADSSAPQRVAGIMATPSLFTTLGVSAQLGRTFDSQESQTGHERVVLLSHALWTHQYAADPDLVGRDIQISGYGYRVIGVMPASFAFPRREVQLWVPAVFSEKRMSDSVRGYEFAQSVGRLKPGASIEQLEAQFAAIIARNVERLGATANGDGPDFRTRVESSGFAGRALPLHAHLAGNFAPALWLLQAAVTLVLLIACVNVANLMLIRWNGRQRELAVRMALGASRARIARQLLLESGVLAGLGGLTGIAVAGAGIGLIRALGLDGGERGFEIGLDSRVLLFALAATAVSALLSGLLPILALWRGRSMRALKGAARASLGSLRERATRNLLVVLQIALAGALLVVAGLLLHSYARLLQQRPGFDSEHPVTASFNLLSDRYRSDEQRPRQFHERLMSAVRALPGVQSAGSVSGMLFSGDYDSGLYVVDAAGQAEAGASSVGYFQIVDEAWFDTLGIPLLKGRGFLPSDNADAPPVAIIDQRLADRAFGDRDPIGARIATPGLDGLKWHTIVGVVASVKRRDLSDIEGRETYYFPHAQSPTRIFRIAIKTELEPADMAGPLRSAVAAIDPQQPVFDIMSMNQRIDRSLDAPRTPMLLLTLFAAVALCLCAVGIYSVLAFAVAQRSGEMGVRMSLGASRRDVMTSVIGDAGRLSAMGLALGLALAIPATQQIRSQLFGIEALDPLTYLVVTVLLAAVALLASWIPARRAASISPVEALRCE
jgi:predicted permease